MKVRDVLEGFKGHLEHNTSTHTGKALTSYTRKVYNSDIHTLLDVLGISENLPANELGNITEAQVQEYMASGNALPGTRLRRLSTARQLFEYCITKGIVTDNPAHGIRYPKTEYAAPSFITHEEYDTILDSLTIEEGQTKFKRFLNARNRVLVRLLYEGFRPEELPLMETRDLMSGDGEHTEKLRLMRTEGVAEIPISGSILYEMRAYETEFFNRFGAPISGERRKKYFRNKNGRGEKSSLRGRSIRRTINLLGNRALGRDDISPKTIYNGFILDLLKNDVPINDIVERTRAKRIRVLKLSECI